MVKRTVLKMTYNGEWTVVFVTDRETGNPVSNPYKIYYKAWVIDDHTPADYDGVRYKTTKKKLADYADFYSCLCYLKDKVQPGDTHALIGR